MSNTYQKRKASKEYGLYNQCKKLNDDELFRLLDDHNSLKRISSARVLQLRGGQDAVRLAIEFCSDKNYIRRDIGAFILGQIKICKKCEDNVFNILNNMALNDIRDCFVEMLQDKNEEVRIEAIIGLSYRKDKRVLSVLCDELKKNTVYDDIIEAAGELGDKTLLPVLDTMLYKFDDNEIITSAIDKLKRS